MLIRYSRFPRLIRSYSIALSYLYNKDPKCKSCGIILQNDSPEKPGYYIRYEKKTPVVKQSDLIYKKYKSKLEDEEVIQMNNTEDSNDSKTVLSCIRCRQIQNYSNFKLEIDQYPIHNLSTIMTTLIPRNAPIVYLFNSLDFPMGINPEIFKFRKPHEIFFIMTKSDNLIQKETAYENYTKQFIEDYLNKKYDVPKENIFITSGKKNWKTFDLYNGIPDQSYIIGSTNCGKSTLINSLLLNKELKSNSSMSFQKRKKFMNRFKNGDGPGTSYLPGYTRDIIPVQIGNKTFFDVPGFTTTSNLLNFYKSMSGKSINQVIKGKQMYKHGTFKSEYFTIKNKQILNLQGLGYVVIPSDSIFQIRNVTNLNLSIQKDLEKVQQLIKDTPVSMKDNFLTNVPLKSMDKYIVPPFFGPVDLVLENIGYINIKPTGKKLSNELIEIYLIPGLQAVLRQSILSYLSKSFTGLDKNYNPLRKENWYEKSTLKLKRYNEAEPFHSKLIKVNEEDRIGNGSNEEVLRKKLGVIYDESVKIDDNNKYLFWRE
ncbi:unnamed protein product [Candida verbasci]|uniref:Genetic interactor of prohibitins 3, mitochondrial n=1 Tax=Candida verbasci TaxID=1227364 RepID=A0A9W4XAE1_9ASCO|nr:unnamed protein product [Candida verbasci]